MYSNRVDSETDAAPQHRAPSDIGSNRGGQGGGNGGVEESPEALEERKRRALQSMLEQQLGGSDPDRVALAQLLQRHGVAVRGGQAEAAALVQALQAWKRGEWKAE